jgi:4-amino-4-deoxy-L-arabinose transferase-like glycosyltransferase
MRDVSRPSHKVTPGQATALDMKKSLLEDRRTFWIVAAVTILLFGIANLPWQLDDYDQAKQALTSFEIIKEGHWFFQRTPHEHVATKPPLVGWVSAGFFAITRSWDVAWRLPSFFAAIALLILLYRSGSTAYGSVSALIAFSSFGFNLLSPRLATLVRTDMPLALVIFLLGLLIWQKIRQHGAWQTRDQLAVFALLIVALFIKGPVVYLFLLPGIAVFEWWRRKSEAISAWCGWLPWIGSFAVFVVWLVGGMVFQPGFFDRVVMREFVSEAVLSASITNVGGPVHHVQPVYFYLPHLVHKFVPWSVLMVALAIVNLHSQNWRLRSILREMSPEAFWLLCWSMGGLFAMSLIPAKRVDRIFPITPPLCLLLAAQVGRSAALRRAVLYRWSTIALLFAMLFAGVYTIAKVVSGYLDHRDALAVFGTKIRHEAEAYHWRYEVVSAKDEGLLLYLRRTHFIKPDQAVAEWNRGNLDALVVSTENAPPLMRDLRDAALAQVRSNERKKEQERDYVLITR